MSQGVAGKSMNNLSEFESVDVLLACAETLSRETFAAFLMSEGVPKVWRASSFDQICSLLQGRSHVDLVLVDSELLREQATDKLATIVALSEPAPVVVVQAQGSEANVSAVLETGVKGIVAKSMPAETLVAGLRFVVGGDMFVPYDLLKQQSNVCQQKLESEDVRVLGLVAEGFSNTEIANETGLSSAVVKSCLKRLCRKLEARNRTQAAVIARQTGLI